MPSSLLVREFGYLSGRPQGAGTTFVTSASCSMTKLISAASRFQPLCLGCCRDFWGIERLLIVRCRPALSTFSRTHVARPVLRANASDLTQPMNCRRVSRVETAVASWRTGQVIVPAAPLGTQRHPGFAPWSGLRPRMAWRSS